MGEQDDVTTLKVAIEELDVAMSGLEEHLWRALARPWTAGAVEEARAASADATGLAHERLNRGDVEGARQAIEAARGLTLYAAAAVRPVADRLAQAGKPDLARRWQAAAGVADPHRLPAALRREVLGTLLARCSAAALLAPPTVAETQSALVATGADALVHLIPGHAVITPAAGPVTHVPLPALTTGSPQVERFLAALALHHATAPGHPLPAADATGRAPEVNSRHPDAAPRGPEDSAGLAGPGSGDDAGRPRVAGPEGSAGRGGASPEAQGDRPRPNAGGPGRWLDSSADARGFGRWPGDTGDGPGPSRDARAANSRRPEVVRPWFAVDQQGPEGTRPWPVARRPRPAANPRTVRAPGGAAGRPRLDDQPVSDLGAALREVGRWSWDAVVGPLLEHLIATHVLDPAPGPGGRPREPRIVLVAPGDLAAVPWPAARCGDGTYALELLAISQAVSARMVCRNAARPPSAPSATGLVVADPDTAGNAGDLPAARLEAYAIRQALYPRARLTGRRPDGTASPSGAGTLEQVRAWLATSNPGAGGTLHLACSGFTRAAAGRPTAYVLMAGGEPLTASEVLALGEGARRPIDLVVLAAGRTGLSLPGQDEAFGLGTAFLAGDVRSVLTSRWIAPAVLFMTHLFRRDGRTVWSALRAAQLWMLDPDRAIPPEMPPALAATVRDTDPIAWAAVTHWGR